MRFFARKFDYFGGAASAAWFKGDGDAPRLVETAAFGANPGALRMLTFAPAARPARAPLVVVLHGCTQSADEYASGAGWLALAEREGFVVLAPEQAAANNPNLCFNWFQPADARRDRGEAASIRAMIAQTLAAHDLDPARVFITGLSAGGAMAAVMLAVYPEMFAGGALISGISFGGADNVQQAFAEMQRPSRRSGKALGDKVRAASSHRGPWPRISVWHGDLDATVRPGAGENSVAQWRDVHGATGPAQERSSPTGRRYEAWTSPSGETVVAHHRIAGMGHGAPLAPAECGRAGAFLLDVGVSSSAEIAADWGIARQRPSPASQARIDTPPPPPHAPVGKIGEVISKALRAAGLLK